MSFSVKKKFVLVQLFVLGYVCANVAYPLLTQRILDQLSGGSFGELKGLFFLLFLSILLLVGCSRGRALSQKNYLNQAVLSGENTGSYFCKTQRATFLGAGSGIFISI